MSNKGAIYEYEWAVYSMKSGSMVASLGLDPKHVDYLTAQAYAERIYGYDVYVAKKPMIAYACA